MERNLSENFEAMPWSASAVRPACSGCHMVDDDVDDAALTYGMRREAKQVSPRSDRAAGLRYAGHNLHQLSLGVRMTREHRIARGELHGLRKLAAQALYRQWRAGLARVADQDEQRRAVRYGGFQLV